TGYSPYELMFGQPAVLPVDVEMETYLGIDWEEVRTTEELLAGRMDQLARKKEVLELGYKRMGPGWPGCLRRATSRGFTHEGTGLGIRRRRRVLPVCFSFILFIYFLFIFFFLVL
ncbi:hypothetical protein PPACK8108_LOCUS10558, partial [Phakopsora pachyrhizi]